MEPSLCRVFAETTFSASLKLANKIFEWLEINGKEVKFRNNNLSAYQTDKMLEKFNGMTAMRISEELLQKASVLAMLKSEKHRLKMSDFK